VWVNLAHVYLAQGMHVNSVKMVCVLFGGQGFCVYEVALCMFVLFEFVLSLCCVCAV